MANSFLFCVRERRGVLKDEMKGNLIYIKMKEKEWDALT